MSEEKGLLCTCDRCETIVFRKFIGTGDLDGGYTKFDKFELLPDDWMHVYEIGDLCPRCATEFRVLMSNFIDQDKLVNRWRMPIHEK